MRSTNSNHNSSDSVQQSERLGFTSRACSLTHTANGAVSGFHTGTFRETALLTVPRWECEQVRLSCCIATVLCCKYTEKSGCTYGENNPGGDGIEEFRSSVRRLRLLSATPGCRMRSRRNRHCMPFKSDLTACQSEVHDAENRDTTKTDRTLQERSC